MFFCVLNPATENLVKYPHPPLQGFDSLLDVLITCSSESGAPGRSPAGAFFRLAVVINWVRLPATPIGRDNIPVDGDVITPAMTQ